MKFLTRLLQFTVWTAAITYFAAVILTHIPAIQKRLAEEVAVIVAEQLDTYCSIESVELGFFNRTLVHGILLKDKQKQNMLKADYIAVTPDFREIFDGRITITGAQLFGTHIKLYKNTKDEPLNCQFLIDALQGKDSKEPSTINLRINSFILRNSTISYDLNYIPHKKTAFIDPDHIAVSGLNANVSLNHLRENDIELDVRKLAFTEQGGLKLNNLSCQFTMLGDSIDVKSLNITLDRGKLQAPHITYVTTSRAYQGSISAEWDDLTLRLNATGDHHNINIQSITLANAERTLFLSAQASAHLNRAEQTRIQLNIRELKGNIATVRKHLRNSFNIKLPKLPGQLENAGNITLKAEASASIPSLTPNLSSLTSSIFTLNSSIQTSNYGNLTLTANKTKDYIIASVNTRQLRLKELLQDNRLQPLTADIDIKIPTTLIKGVERLMNKGDITLQDLHTCLNKTSPILLKTTVHEFGYDGSSFNNLGADLNINNSMLKGKVNVPPQNKFSFNADINLDISRLGDSRLMGQLLLENLHFAKYDIAYLQTDISDNHADIHTPFADIQVNGDIKLAKASDLDLDAGIHIKSLAAIDSIFKLNLDLEGNADIQLSLRGDTVSGRLLVPQTQISGIAAKNIDIQFNYHDLQLSSSINLENTSRKNSLKLAVNPTIKFKKNTAGGLAAVDVHLFPSQVFLRDTLFTISESNLSYHDNTLAVEALEIKHEGQHVIINGVASNNPNDSILIDINDIDVSYILDFINFHSVSFSGNAVGHAVCRNIFNEPEASAKLTVSDFRFEHGQMGTLTLNAAWNNEDQQIEIQALCNDTSTGDVRLTQIEGYINPELNYINLQINADNTRCDFIGNYCKSFLSDTHLGASGKVRLWGDMRFINLTGIISASGKFHVNALGTDYTLTRQTVEFIPNDILFPSDTIRDKYGNHAILTGALHHQYLAKMTFDIGVQPHNLLAYDFPTYGNETFFGKAFVTGKCDITGRPGQTIFNVQADIEKNSFIEFNASTPDAVTAQSFIKWHDRTPRPSENAPAQGGGPLRPGTASPSPETTNDFVSDVHLNISANITPKATLRVLMDSKSQDKITLQGSGDIKATWYNKGKFLLYGNYIVEKGSYNMTIQNILQKNFNFQKGGQITFAGDPYDSQLTLQAIYPVKAVPLTDLQVAANFKNNNVPVNCIMDITGTAGHPQVEFDFDLPSLSSDAKSMIHALLNSQQEKNQQVLYLLAVGRFYSQGDAQSDQRQSQASLAMQSFLSGTVSQQINNALGTIIKNNNNWSFGANISPGDDGFNNAQYEGILSGSLLNNRLLINGQFGYRDKANATSSFIGDFDVRYLLIPSGNISLRVYNQTNDRYFTRTSLNTQGIGLILKYDFQTILPRKRRRNNSK